MGSRRKHSNGVITSIRFIDINREGRKKRERERERQRERQRESRSFRDFTNKIVMMHTCEEKSAITTPRKREGGKAIDKFGKKRRN